MGDSTSGPRKRTGEKERGKEAEGKQGNERLDESCKVIHTAHPVYTHEWLENQHPKTAIS